MAKWVYLQLCLFFSLLGYGQNQQVSIEFDPTEPKVGAKFFIKVSIKNTNEYEVKGFPEVPGLAKAGVSVSHINLANKIVHVVTQNYTIEEDRNIYVKPFVLNVNSMNYSFQGYQKVKEKPQEEEENLVVFENIEETLFYISTSKKEVFVGEGVKVTIGFYISENDNAPWEFPNNLGAQIEEIADRIKLKNCLVSRLQMNSIPNSLVRVKNINYTFYKLFEAVFYPLTDEELKFPSVKLRMSKGQQNYQDFYSNSTFIKVNPLPDHPLKDQVPVGVYKLTEKLDSSTVSTGKTFNYSFEITGKGSFNGLNDFTLKSDSHLDFFPPTIDESIRLGREYGSKSISYKVFPKDAGIYNFKDYYSLVFFNPAKKNYDTLSPLKKINIIGQSFESIETGKLDLYEKIQNLDATKESTDYKEIIKIAANILLCLMLVAMITIFVLQKIKNNG